MNGNFGVKGLKVICFLLVSFSVFSKLSTLHIYSLCPLKKNAAFRNTYKINWEKEQREWKTVKLVKQGKN